MGVTTEHERPTRKRPDATGRPSVRWGVAAGGLLWLAGCTGVVDLASGAGNLPGGPGGSGPGQQPLDPNVTVPNIPRCTEDMLGKVGDTPLRRLTRDEYDNSVRDLLGITSAPAQAFPPDGYVGAFPGNSVSPVTDTHVRAFETGAETTIEQAIASGALAGQLPCAAASGNADCAAQFIRDFGRKAFRRPLSEDQVTALAAVYNVGAETGFMDGIRLVTSAILQSPYFLYHVEEKLPSEGTVALAPSEIASRLSYFLWDSVPDAELLRAVDAGELETPEGIRAQATRMLDDPKARPALRSFTENWLAITGAPYAVRDTNLFPHFTADYGVQALEESVRFVDHVLREGDGTWDTLMTASFSFPTGPLFATYGVPASNGTGPVELPAHQRAGVLTHPSVLTVHSRPDTTSPIKRGIFLLHNVLCVAIQPPTGLEIPDLPDKDPSLTTRERFVLHTEDAGCASCHKAIDPLGFAFERYDPIGAYRDMEANKVIDDDAMISVGDSSGLDGPVDGAVELAFRIAESEFAQSCMTKQLHRLALNRMEQNSDACSLVNLYGRFKEHRSVRELILDIVTQDTFRFRPGAS